MPTQFSAEVHVLAPSAGSTSHQYQLVDNLAQLERLLCTPKSVVVTFHFDPFCEQAGDELKGVCSIANGAGAAVYTYSTSHVEWLENLTTQLGASKHFLKLTDIQAENILGEFEYLR